MSIYLQYFDGPQRNGHDSIFTPPTQEKTKSQENNQHVNNKESKSKLAPEQVESEDDDVILLDNDTSNAKDSLPLSWRVKHPNCGEGQGKVIPMEVDENDNGKIVSESQKEEMIK